MQRNVFEEYNRAALRIQNVEADIYRALGQIEANENMDYAPQALELARETYAELEAEMDSLKDIIRNSKKHVFVNDVEADDFIIRELSKGHEVSPAIFSAEEYAWLVYIFN